MVQGGGRKKKSGPPLTPLPLLFKGTRDEQEKQAKEFRASLITNSNSSNGFLRLAHCDFNEGGVKINPAKDIIFDEINFVRHATGDIAFAELRYRLKRGDDNKKRFRDVFRAEEEGKPAPILVTKLKTLADAGLFIPYGLPEFCDTIRKAKELGYTVSPILTEGVHAWNGVRRLFAHESVQDELQCVQEERQTLFAPLAWLGGKSGAGFVNWTLAAFSKSDGAEIHGVNDRALDWSDSKLIGDVIIVPDCDKDGDEEAKQIMCSLVSFNVDKTHLFKVPRVRGWDTCKPGWDDNDPLPLNVHELERFEQFVNAEPFLFNDYRETKRGEVIHDASNVLIFLKKQRRGVVPIFFDEFSYCKLVEGPMPQADVSTATNTVIYPRQISDSDLIDLQIWIQKNPDFAGVNMNVVEAAVDAYARGDCRHVVRDYLRSLNWDGVKRLDTWLVDYLNAKDNPEYLKLIGAKFPIQMVARVMTPGCKGDYVPIFKGPEGIYKSGMLRVLAGEQWFDDGLPEISADSNVRRKLALHLRGKWLLELPEMASLSNAQIEAVKAFLSAVRDSYLLPYGQHETEQQRQCCFAATTNLEHPLKDTAGGNRRFPIVHIGSRIDLERLKEARDQLWAEAYYRFTQGEEWWSTPEQEAKHFKPVQDENLREETWQEELREELVEFENYPGICFQPATIYAFIRERSRKEPRGDIVGTFLRKLGWTTSDKLRLPKETVTLRLWWRADQLAPNELVEPAKPQFLLYRQKSFGEQGVFYANAKRNPNVEAPLAEKSLLRNETPAVSSTPDPSPAKTQTKRRAAPPPDDQPF